MAKTKRTARPFGEQVIAFERRFKRKYAKHPKFLADAERWVAMVQIWTGTVLINAEVKSLETRRTPRKARKETPDGR